MVRPPRFDSNGVKSGVWSKEEDDTLRAFVEKNGHHNWQKLPFLAGLARSGKSCRLRWMNYLQPGLKKGKFSQEEVDLIIRLHNQIGNRWSVIAENLPGRTDNDIKNHWHAHIKKRLNRSRAVEIGHQEQTTGFNNQENTNNRFLSTPTSFGSSHGGIDHTCFTQFNTEDEFSDFGSSHNDTPAFSDSSEGSGIDHTCFSQLDMHPPPLIPEEEFSTFGYSCHNDTPTFLDSLDGEITYDDYNSFTQLDVDLSSLILEDLFSTFGLCRNDTPTFSDSSDGGITYDHTCFSQLSIDPPQFQEEDFSAFGLYKNDDTPTISDSSDGGITYDPPQFQEEDFSAFGLYQNDDMPSFSDSSNGADSILKNMEREAFYLNHLERTWYFGDDV